MPRAHILCLAAALVAVPMLVARAEDAKPPSPPAAAMPAAPAPPASPAASAATPAAPSAEATTADDDDAQRRMRAATDKRAMFEAKLAALHAGLLLTPDQEAMWPAVERAIRGFVATRTALADERADRRQDADDDDEWNGHDPVAALKIYSEALTQRAAAIKAVADSAAPLWATMTDDQKHRLPVLLRQMNPRPMKHGPRWDESDRGREAPDWRRDRSHDEDTMDEPHDDRRNRRAEDRGWDDRGAKHGPRDPLADEDDDGRW